MLPIGTKRHLDRKRRIDTGFQRSVHRLCTEHGVEEDPEASDEDRAVAKARIGQLADIIARVEESDA